MKIRVSLQKETHTIRCGFLFAIGFEPIKCNTSLHAEPNSACHCEEGRKHRRGNLPVR